MQRPRLSWSAANEPPGLAAIVERTAAMNLATAMGKRTGESSYGEKEVLHQRCGIYTKPDVVRRILDAVGWRADVDLSEASLLEPAAGDGAFVVEAARRLIASYTRYGVELSAASLTGRIMALELHPREARRAKARVIKILRELDVYRLTAEACARNWITNSDFLLAKLPSHQFTHAVGNPPYVRWSKIPPTLKAKYNRVLPRDMVGGDLFLPFLHRALELLRSGGKCGFLCSDRWRYMAFAEGFRNHWLPLLDIHSEDSLQPNDAFVEAVDSYPSILIASKRASTRQPPTLALHRSGRTLAELGCLIKVGPALGHTPAFVLNADESDVEPELLKPWVEASEIRDGIVVWGGRRVITMNQSDGQLVDLERFPLLKARLARYRSVLKKRFIVRHGAPWFRPIDHVRATDWTRPKLLVPELAKVPRCAVDRSGSVPSHGVYAIFARHDDVDALYEKLKDGQLANALEGIAPRVKGGYVRCYRRFLAMIRVD